MRGRLNLGLSICLLIILVIVSGLVLVSCVQPEITGEGYVYYNGKVFAWIDPPPGAASKFYTRTTHKHETITFSTDLIDDIPTDISIIPVEGVEVFTGYGQPVYTDTEGKYSTGEMISGGGSGTSKITFTKVGFTSLVVKLPYSGVTTHELIVILVKE